MQLKLKENPQTPSVFQRKELKPKPLKYLFSHLVTSSNLQKKIKPVDTIKIKSQSKKLNSSKKTKINHHLPKILPGSIILTVSRPSAELLLELHHKANKWTLTKQNSLN